MSFRQQLASRSVNTQQAYEAETQQMLQTWRAEIKPKFIRACEEAADLRQCSCALEIAVPQNLWSRDLRMGVLKQPLQEILMELGFPDGTVTELYAMFRLQVQWSHEDATCSILQPHPQMTRGTCTTCPICLEHRPAVALVPCGHVVCRDCHHSGQLLECPFCRGPIISATNGLFMD